MSEGFVLLIFTLGSTDRDRHLELTLKFLNSGSERKRFKRLGIIIKTKVISRDTVVDEPVGTCPHLSPLVNSSTK